MTDQELILRGYISTLPAKKQKKVASLSKELVKHIESIIKENGDAGVMAASLSSFAIAQMIGNVNKKGGEAEPAEPIKGEE